MKELSTGLMWLLFQLMQSLGNGIANTELIDAELVTYISNLAVAIKPIGYALLAVFAVLELVQLSERMGNINGFAGTGLVIEVLIKVILCKVVVDNSVEICQFIISVTDGASQLIADTNAELITYEQVASFMDDVFPWAIDVLGRAAMFIIIAVFCFLSLVCIAVVYVIFIARVIEIYAYFAISPIPLSTCLSKNFNVVPNFIKNLFAIGLQGTLLILLVRIYNILIISELGNIIRQTPATGIFSFIVGGGHSGYAQCLQMLITTALMSILMLVCAFQTQKWAKSICHAM